MHIFYLHWHYHGNSELLGTSTYSLWSPKYLLFDAFRKSLKNPGLKGKGILRRGFCITKFPTSIGNREGWKIPVYLGFSGGTDSKDYACHTGDLSSILGLDRSPGSPLQYSHLENFMDRGAWWLTDHGPQRVAYNWVTHTTHFWGEGPEGISLWKIISTDPEENYTDNPYLIKKLLLKYIVKLFPFQEKQLSKRISVKVLVIHSCFSFSFFFKSCVWIGIIWMEVKNIYF